MATQEIDLTVYPDECDAFGHLNQASFLALFERARWEMLARGPGMDIFSRNGAWPAVRKATVDYSAPAYPGDVLRFHQALTHRGRTSFTLRQTARRVRDDALIATAEFVFVCVDREGKPTPVPVDFGEFMNARPTPRGGARRVTVNGVNLAVNVEGEGSTVLFIHGYPLDRTIWEPQVAGLDRWRRIAPDLRGMGLSDAPDLGYSMATYAADLAALLDAFGVDRAVLCGLSMGGYIAFEFLRRWRERVAGLILVDTRAEADSAEGKRLRDEAAGLAREGGAVAIAEAMLPNMLAGSASAELVRRVREVMAAAPVAGIVGALGAMRERPDSAGMLASLTGLPTLILVGAEDRLTPPARASAMASAIPEARMIVVAGAAHLPTLEQPTVVTDAIRGFLGGLEAW